MLVPTRHVVELYMHSQRRREGGEGKDLLMRISVVPLLLIPIPWISQEVKSTHRGDYGVDSGRAMRLVGVGMVANCEESAL
jgi:hypothetical protein